MFFSENNNLLAELIFIVLIKKLYFIIHSILNYILKVINK